MYAQKEKPKENKNRAVANAVALKKSNGKQGFGFVDNRHETVVQRKLQGGLNESARVIKVVDSNVLQRKLEVDGKRFDKSFTTEELEKIIPERSNRDAVIETINKVLGLEYEYRFERWIDVVHAAERQSDPSKWLSDKNVNRLLLHTLKPVLIGKQEGHKKGERWAVSHERHGLISPLESPEEWGKSIKKERVSDLFLTLKGLKGHAQQIDGEIKRAKKDIEKAPSDVQIRILNQLGEIRNALIAAANDAKFDFEEVIFDFYQPLRMKMKNGKLSTS
jgi:hypothetical protein